MREYLLLQAKQVFDVIPPTTLNKLIPHEKRSSLVQANSSKEKGCKREKVCKWREGECPTLPLILFCAQWSYSVIWMVPMIPSLNRTLIKFPNLGVAWFFQKSLELWKMHKMKKFYIFIWNLVIKFFQSHWTILGYLGTILGTLGYQDALTSFFHQQFNV